MTTRKQNTKLFWLISYFFTMFFLLGLIKFQTYAVPYIEAQSAILIDADTGKVLYEKNADWGMIPGSMTKVMTCYIVFEEIQKGNLSFDTPITITYSQSQASVNKSYPACVPLIAGSRITVDTLLKLVLLPSASASCIVLAETISGSQTAFVERMNETAQRLGMTDSVYKNCHGAGIHYITARDQARLVQAFLEQFPHFLNYTSTRYVTHNGVTYQNLNYLLDPSSANYYPYCDGIKTGSYSTSGHCLTTTASRNGNRVISIVFKASTEWNQQADSKNLLEYGLSLMESGDYYPYNDTSPYPEIEPIYFDLQNLGVNVQSVGGWVRPTEEMTYGEFATTFMNILEKLQIIPTLDKISDKNVWDLNQYPHKDVIYRGITLGILPLKEEGFLPNRPFTYDDLQIHLDWIAHLYSGRLRSPSQLYEDNLPEVEPIPPEEEVSQEVQSEILDQKVEILDGITVEEPEIVEELEDSHYDAFYYLQQEWESGQIIPRTLETNPSWAEDLDPWTQIEQEKTQKEAEEQARIEAELEELARLEAENSEEQQAELEKVPEKVENFTLSRGYALRLLYEFFQQNGYF